MKKDKTFYAAWIMIAACAQELKQFNQAQYALMKAIELDENQPAAHLVKSKYGEKGFISISRRV